MDFMCDNCNTLNKGNNTGNCANCGAIPATLESGADRYTPLIVYRWTCSCEHQNLNESGVCSACGAAMPTDAEQFQEYATAPSESTTPAAAVAAATGVPVEETSIKNAKPCTFCHEYKHLVVWDDHRIACICGDCCLQTIKIIVNAANAVMAQQPPPVPIKPPDNDEPRIKLVGR